MVEQLSQVHSELIQEIARRNGFVDFEVETNPGSAKGDNYLGIIRKVTIKNRNRKLELILKTPAADHQGNDPFSHNIFLREIYIYEVLLKEFRKFQEERRISAPFLGYAQFYGKCAEEGRECVIMENLVENGYRLCDRSKPLSAGHIAAVFVEYAKFHAISLALRYKKPDFFEELTREIKNDISITGSNNEEEIKKYVNSVINSACEAVADDPVAVEVLKNFGNHMPGHIMKDMRNPDLAMAITHGDNWCNNMMFKYENPDHTDEPTKVCILDWQLSKKDSPVADLACFFLMHSPKEILYDYKKFLKLYHNTVSKNLREFACDPEEILPFSIVERHWNIFVKFGFFLSLLIIKFMYCESDEIKEKEGDFFERISLEIKKSKEYNQRIKDLLEFVIDNRFI